MRLTWLTDVHLNFLRYDATDEFLHGVRKAEPDAVLITGDIAEAHDLRHYLETIDDRLECPIYFVLGNHDYYHGSIAGVRNMVIELCELRPRLHYLSACELPIELAPSLALVGHDGWADGRFGNYEQSIVQMVDWRLIKDFVGQSKLARLPIVQGLGDAAAAHVRRQLEIALRSYEKVIVLTHVPPLREACWHQGKHSDDHWAPHFASKAMGDVLLEMAAANPHRTVEVLCGHTHGIGECQPLPNLRIYTGGAEYGRPHIQRVLQV
jgi:3',5'-cyclic-AMP phosphodiesterase